MIETMKVPPPEMFDDYDVGKTWTPPPQAKALNEKGKLQGIVYEAVVPGAEGITFRPDKNGFLMAVIDGFTIDEHVLNAEYLSSAPFPKKAKDGTVMGTRNASSLGNYLRAMGLGDARPASPEEYETLVLATAGQTVRVVLDWEGYDRETRTTIATKWEQFPDDPDDPALKQPFIEVDGRRVWARARIKRFVAV